MEWKESFSGDEIMKMANAIYNACFKKCWELRDDLVSEGVLGIMQAIENYDKNKGVCLSTYAWNMGKGRMLNYYNNEKELMQTFTKLGDCDWVSDEFSISDKMAKDDKFAKICSIIEKMKADDQVLTWKMMKGYSIKEIAESSNVTPQCVWIKWKRVREKILREYEGKGVKGR